MTKRCHFVAANPYEGCGHRHRTKKAARKCLPRIEKRGKKAVYKVCKKK